MHSSDWFVCDNTQKALFVVRNGKLMIVQSKILFKSHGLMASIQFCLCLFVRFSGHFNLLLSWEVEKWATTNKKKSFLSCFCISHHHRRLKNKTSINWVRRRNNICVFFADWKKCYISKWFCGLPFGKHERATVRFLRKRSPSGRLNCLMNNDLVHSHMPLLTYTCRWLSVHMKIVKFSFSRRECWCCVA